MYKNLNCCSGLFNSDKLLILKYGSFMFDLKNNFVNNKKISNTCRFLISYALKFYETRGVKKSFRGSNFVQRQYSYCNSFESFIFFTLFLKIKISKKKSESSKNFLANYLPKSLKKRVDSSTFTEISFHLNRAP